MKKFLPFIIFGMVFFVVVIWQVTINKFEGNSVSLETSSEYLVYEKLFLDEHFTTLDGHSLELKNLSTPLVIVNFWASWCIPCLDEMPSMLALKKSITTDKMSIVAINTDEDEQLKNIQKIKNKIKFNDEFIIIPDKEGRITGLFNVNAIPVSIIFLNGKVVHLSNGPMDFYSEEFKEKVKAWLL